MNVSKKDETEEIMKQSIQRHNNNRHQSKVISRKSDYSIVNQNQVKAHLDGVLPSK